MTVCPACGKKYPAQETECPHCSSTETPQSQDDQQTLQADKESEKTLSTDQLSEPGIPDDNVEDLEKWLRGEDTTFSSWATDFPPASEQKAAVAATQEVFDQSEKVIEDWLQGKVDDITPWLTGETEAQTISRQIEIPEEAREAYKQVAAEEFERIITDLKEGKTTIEEVGGELLSLLTEMEALRKKNERLNEEIEMVRKGSTVITKYFKNIHGKEDFEADKAADQLAEEMARREQLEIENIELRTSMETLKEQLEKDLKDFPDDEQELKRLGLETAESMKYLNKRENFLKEKEKRLTEQEAGSRHELRERFSAELQERISKAEKNETRLRAEIEKFMIRNKEIEIELKHKNEQLQLSGSKSERKEFVETLKERLADYQRLEREIDLRNQEVQSLRGKLTVRESELNALKEPMRYKEDEIILREEDLMHREKILEEEIMRLEQAKAEFTSQDEIELKKRLEMLQASITAKEEEIANREKYLSAKEQDLKFREEHVISEEIDTREEERTLEYNIEKVKTGNVRLDDLLIGGLPFGTNVLIYGPAFTGKEIITNSFVAEGLKKGVPTIWVTTEKTPEELREEMKYILSGFEEYEKLGLVKFVDSYSKSMGDETNDPNVYYVDSPTDFQSLQKGIEQTTKEMLSKHKYYRFIFRSISTMIAYLDPATAYKFLNPIIGRRKRDKAVSMFIIEKGMHGEQEIQMVGSLMDGMIELKVENLNTFLSVRGIGEVQSRAWIRYTATKSSLNIGSFSLDHIR